MDTPFKVGDKVIPRPTYERCACICGQCKRKNETNWLYYAFRKATVLRLNEDGTVDVGNKKSQWVRIPPEMLEKA